MEGWGKLQRPNFDQESNIKTSVLATSSSCHKGQNTGSEVESMTGATMRTEQRK